MSVKHTSAARLYTTLLISILICLHHKGTSAVQLWKTAVELASKGPRLPVGSIQGMGDTVAKGIGGGASTTSVEEDAKVLLGKSGRRIPSIFVLDLDSTIWNCPDAAQLEPPFYREGGDAATDLKGNKVEIHPHTRDILRAVQGRGKSVAIASLNPSKDKCVSLLQTLGLWEYVSPGLVHIYNPGVFEKARHFEGIHRQSKVPYTEMLFFDDNFAHVKAAQKRGLAAVHVTKKMGGVSLQVLEEGLRQFHQAHGSRNSMMGWLKRPTAGTVAASKEGEGSRKHTDGEGTGKRASLEGKEAEGEGSGGVGEGAEDLWSGHRVMNQVSRHDEAREGSLGPRVAAAGDETVVDDGDEGDDDAQGSLLPGAKRQKLVVEDHCRSR